MVFPAITTVTGHALCGVSMSTTCEECQSRFYNNNSEQQEEAVKVNPSQANSPSNVSNTNENEESNRTLKTENKPTMPQPILLSQRQQSVTLFARPLVTQDLTTVEENNIEVKDERINKTTVVHQKDGEDSVFEIDYEGDSTAASNQVISGKSEYFIDGDFHNGKIRDIETPQYCYNIKFNIDATILAIGLDNNGGVLLYETIHFSLLGTIDRDDSVAALDWVDNPFNEGGEGSVKTHETDSAQLLAVGGFDGVVSIYSIVQGSSTKPLVTLLYDVRVKSDVLSMAFLRDNATNYVPLPLALAIGERNGRVSMFLTDGETNQFKSASKMSMIDIHESAVLALAFGFIEQGIIMATGTKNGIVRVSLVIHLEGEWKLSHLLFQYPRLGAIRSLRFNHDSTSLIVGGYDKTVLIVDTYLWSIVREIFVDGTVCTIEYDPYHRYLLIGTRSKMLTIVDTSTLHQIKTIHTNGWVTSVSWGGDSLIAMRSDDKLVTLIKFEPMQTLAFILESSRGEECSLSWSFDGRFLSRTYGNEVIINDSKKGFEEVSRLGQSQPVRAVRFCQAEGKRERLAIVGNDGFLRVFQLRISVGTVHVEALAAIFLEPNLWAVGWSTDGNCIMAGGKNALLHFISANTYQPLCEAKKTWGRINTIDALSQQAQSNLDDHTYLFGAAISMGQNVAQIFDMNSFEAVMEITRKRTVRCLRYHPFLPILAIGDGSNEIILLDLIGERRIASFYVDGRVNSIDFSPLGDFIAVGSDACTFTIHEITTFKVVQVIPAKGFAMAVAFSGVSGKYLAVGHADGETDIIQLGPLLNTEYISLTGVQELPSWAFNEAIYRSPQGRSFLQRCMCEGSKESLICAARVLKNAPDTVLTFDRTTGVGCFETAVQLRQPRIMQLILTTLVDGTLESQNELSRSLLTTTMPIDGFLTLRDLIVHHPPGYATDILRSMTFIKVPFVEPIRVRSEEKKECGSPYYISPWNSDKLKVKNEMQTKNKNQSDGRDQEILVPAVLPLPGLGTLDFLSALITHTGPDVFDNDAMGLVLVVMWEAGVRYYFLIDFSMNVMFCVIWVFFVDCTSQNTSNANNAGWVVTCLTWATFTLNCVFIGEQIIRIVGRQGKKFRSTWHYFDVITIILVFCYTILIIVSDVEDNSYLMIQNSGKGNVPLAVITTLFLTASFISLLRGFDRTGWLVAVLTQNFLDVRGFIVVIVSILFGFTIAFRILFAGVNGQCMAVLDESNALINDCDDEPFGSLARSLVSTFELTILGSYESSMMYESNQILLSAIVFVIAVTVVLVVALNALIAVLGDSFSRVQENVTANRRRERAELIVEYLSMMPSRQRKKIEHNNQYFHALLASDGHGDLLMHKEDWQGGLNALKRELTELTEANNRQTYQAINQLREELKHEVSIMMRNEFGTTLNDIFVEVKEISKSQRAGQLPPSKQIQNSVKVMQPNFKQFDSKKMKNFAPLSSIRRIIKKPLLLEEDLLKDQQVDTTTLEKLAELPEDASSEQNIQQGTNFDEDDDDGYPNLTSSATFG